MPSAGFETAIPAVERPQTYALDRTAIEIGKYHTGAIKSSMWHAWDMKEIDLCAYNFGQKT